MDAREAARLLDLTQIGQEGSDQLFALMRNAGLVAVFGASDDLMEFRGAIYDEADCYDGGRVYLNQKGLAVSKCPEGSDCPYFQQALKTASYIDAVWNDPDQPVWTYRTDIPHETFIVLEDDTAYCRGIVFALADCHA